MRIEVIDAAPARISVTVPEANRIDVIHRRVEITVIDMEA